MTLQSHFAKYIRDRRLELKMTIDEVSILAYGDISRKSMISNIENEKRSVKIDTMEKILTALNSRCEFIQNK
ncbi:helix-turn-helix domain-containing protein [Flavobacterium sp. HSC-61S13]|uniref:helix-turn-helix domain-containing protein n=1 Tax=Flavobacterium sp. HSC-61S13 TaxID=2910963 RepID=UPI0020A0D8ED|nr:helix-turn-helix transcriptional regulator [Flavobacterium sp. HSC-61S13]MCP1996689.1 transcriptional regulator with XRE-family HTH domain [Flavobacterium sp. HSC-61S13]